ncbi:molybdopterin-containing oxidoreductase family protein [Slackia exigua]|uniref:molybdopterin-containing oxidoreductase family protein n=1 Tax=Slackia exigua TaxID=84109 RepID=UPI002004BE71|nr:molybdopterin-dependent oxidoreductase [Slackia exigua]MCK6139963.1 molybdopterin-dependent oxidoreductase [Slackia exigua]
MKGFLTSKKRSFAQLEQAAKAAQAVTSAGFARTSALVETDDDYAESGVKVEKHHSCCHNCYNCCPVWVYTEDGVAVKIEGDENGTLSKGSICTKCLNQLHLVYSPRHVVHPMKRVGHRGSNDWQTISWDEALDLAGEQMALATRKFGPYSIMVGAGGGGTYGNVFQRVTQDAIGAPVCISGGGCQCYLPADCAGQWMRGGSNNRHEGNNAREMWNAWNPTMECVVLWGSQTSASGAAYAARANADMRERGIKTIVVDPYYTEEAAKADIWLPLRPMSDIAMLLGWFRYIIANKLYDEHFCKYWTNYPFLIDPDTRLPLKAEEVWPDYVNPSADPNDVYDTPAYVCFDARTNSVKPFPFTAPEDSPVDPVVFCEAEVNGRMCKTGGQVQWEACKSFTLEKTARLTWVDANTIEEAIKLYATTLSGIGTGQFADMTELSSNFIFGTMGLDILCGKVDKPGVVLTEQKPESRHTVRPTHFWCGRPYQETFGVGWTVGLTEGENRRRSRAAIERWNQKGVDGEAKQREFVDYQLARLGTAEHKATHQWQLNALAPVRKALLTGEPYRISVRWEQSGNKYCVMGHGEEWNKAYANIDFCIHQQPHMTSTTIEDADLFLPLQEWLEFEHATETTTQFNQTYMRKQIVHVGETADPFIVVTQVVDKLSEKLGGDDKLLCRDFQFNGTYRTKEDIYPTWAEMFGVDDWQEAVKHSEDHTIEVPIDELYQFYQYLDIVEDGLPAGFGTLSRKCEPYVTMAVMNGHTGFPYNYPYEQVGPNGEWLEYDAVCTYREQSENMLQDDPDYPFYLTTGRIAHYHHTTLRNAPLSRELIPVPDMRMNPADAEKVGVKHGDWVELSSRRGATRGRVYITEGVRPGVVMMERFYFPEAYDKSQKAMSGGWRECNVNLMARDDMTNDTFASATWRGYRVNVVKADKPEGIWTEPEEFQPFMPTLQKTVNTPEVFQHA